MRRFFAGVLSSLTALAVLSVSVPAYAADVKNVTKPGEISYEVVAKSSKIVLNVVLPAQMKAALNPYGNDFQLNDQNTIHTQNGIVSVAYPVHNYDTDWGVYIDAVAVTATSNEKTWSVTTDALTPGERGANMALTASKTEAGIAEYSNVKKAATGAASQGNLPLSSTVPADKENGISKGQTSQKKLAYIPASADGETPSIIYIGFAGKLAEDSADTVINWTENDYINVNLVLKLTPAPKTL